MSDPAKPVAPPVQRLGRRLACTNTVLNVYFDTVELGPGLKIDDYMVVAPKHHAVTDKLLTGVAILPVFQDQIGLLAIHRPAMAEAGWEIPRGFIDAGEAPEASAHRELKEETGLSCAAENLISLGTVCQEPGILQARTALYSATDCTAGEVTETAEPGLGDISYFRPAEIAEMVATSAIEDACTLVCWYRYQATLTR